MRKTPRLFAILIALCAAMVFAPQPASAAFQSQICANGFLVGFNTMLGIGLDVTADVQVHDIYMKCGSQPTMTPPAHLLIDARFRW